jgi:hypothetical protein
MLSLPALDALNPLGFFAALGLLRVLDANDQRARLAFADRLAVLDTPLSLDEVIGIVLADAAAQRANPALRLAYDEGGLVDPDAAAAVRDLKPKPGVAREFLRRCAAADRRVADLAAALVSDVIQDRAKGNAKPTAFHFTAGKQTFLSMVEGLRAGIGAADLREALVGPWRYESLLPSLSWDSTMSRNYALRASDPSAEKRGSVPGAYWLAVQGLAFFPVVVAGDELRTTGVAGGWKTGVFRWPVWSVPLSVPVAAALLRLDAAALSARERAAFGIADVFASRITRADSGGYGAFSPADVVIE